MARIRVTEVEVSGPTLKLLNYVLIGKLFTVVLTRRPVSPLLNGVIPLRNNVSRLVTRGGKRLWWADNTRLNPT